MLICPEAFKDSSYILLEFLEFLICNIQYDNQGTKRFWIDSEVRNVDIDIICVEILESIFVMIK